MLTWKGKEKPRIVREGNCLSMFDATKDNVPTSTANPPAPPKELTFTKPAAKELTFKGRRSDPSL